MPRPRKGDKVRVVAPAPPASRTVERRPQRLERVDTDGTGGVLYPIQRYHVRVKYLGLFTFVCPICGYISRRNTVKTHFIIKCSDCRTNFIHGSILYLLPAGGRRSIPPDYVIPDEKGERALQEAFPLGDIGHWRQGGCVHGMREMKEPESNDERMEANGRTDTVGPRRN